MDRQPRHQLLPAAFRDFETFGELVQSAPEELVAPSGKLRQLLKQEPDDAQNKPENGFESDENEKKKLDEESKRSQTTQTQLARLRKPIHEIKIQSTAEGRIPEDRAGLDSQQEPTILIAAVASSPPLTDRYTAGFQHQPLFYEQPNLERCGRSFQYLQNGVSGFQFLANTMVLPYRICSERAACPTTAGGDCLSCQTYPVDGKLLPIHSGALATEAAALAGFSFLLL